MPNAARSPKRTGLNKISFRGLALAAVAVSVCSAGMSFSATSASAQRTEAGSWGGKVRSGPGTNFRQIGSLQNGDPVRLIRNTGVMMGQYPWFEISFANGRRGYKWGGILCGFNGPINGTFRVCERDNRARFNGGNQGGGNQGGVFPVAAKSGGGIVRAGPGLQFRRITSLREFEDIRVIRNTGVMLQGFPWFEIRFRGGQRGFQAGGLICSTNRPFAGTFDTCANYRASLNRSGGGNQNAGGNPGGGVNNGVFPVRARTGGGVVRSGPGTQFRRITSLRQLERIRVMGNTGVIMNGYPWFRIRFRNGRRGHMWGGIICSGQRPFAGTFDTCRNFRRTLAGNVRPRQGNNQPRNRARVVQYECDGQIPMTVTFRGDTATYSYDSGPRITVRAQRTGSGFSFSDGFHELRGKGRRLTIFEGGSRLGRCSS